MIPPERRWKVHCSAGNQSLLGRAIRKYGQDNFVFCVIDETASKQAELNQRELYWSTLLNTWIDGPNSHGYNVRQCGGAHGHHSVQTAQKISEMKRGKYTGESNPFYGKHHSESTRAALSSIARDRWKDPNYTANHSIPLSSTTKLKISESLKDYYQTHAGTRTGVSLSKETRAKIANRYYPKGEESCWFGRHHSEETKEKISRSRKGKCVGEQNGMYGKHHTEESKQKMRESSPDQHGANNPMYGRKHSTESRKKMSISHADVSGSNNPRAIKILCVETGEVFDCMKDAAASAGVSQSLLSTYFSKHRETCGGKTWKKI